VPVRGDQGEVRLWFGTNTDITRELENQEKLERAVQARDMFLSIASHELKTPLTPLTLQLQSIVRLAEKGDGKLSVEKVKEKVGKAGYQVAHLERLVDNLLDVSRLSENRLVLDLETLDLGALVEAIVERFRPELEATGTTVKVDAARATGSWDRLRLDQVITNLLTNALKYGGGKPVAVEVRSTDDGARLRVRDHGIGIAPRDQARIFGRFERAVSDHNYGGFGLGLWIARQLVEAMGGKIELESREGEGSTFTVVVPKETVARKSGG
jgi:signal transduction histidine kinase